MLIAFITINVYTFSYLHTIYSSNIEIAICLNMVSSGYSDNEILIKYLISTFICISFNQIISIWTYPEYSTIKIYCECLTSIPSIFCPAHRFFYLCIYISRYQLIRYCCYSCIIYCFFCHTWKSL